MEFAPYDLFIPHREFRCLVLCCSVVDKLAQLSFLRPHVQFSSGQFPLNEVTVGIA